MNNHNLCQTGFLSALLLVLAGLSSTVYAQRELPIAFLEMDALFASASGEMFAAEGFAGTRIFSINENGSTTVHAEGLDGPIDMAEDDQGNLYVTNFNAASVSKVSPTGEITAFADVLPFPAGIVSDSAGNFYVSHFGEADPLTGFGSGDTILKITSDGEVSVFSQGGYLDAPVGIAIDAEDTVYSANFHDGIVVSIDAYGQQHFIADLTGPEVTFAIGHIEFANRRIFATGILDKVLFKVNPRNGNVRTRDISNRVTFPNGVTFNPVENSLFVATGFVNVASLFRVNFRGTE